MVSYSSCIRALAIGWLVSATAFAQTFPLTIKAYWNPNPVSDAVTSYTLTVDGGAPTSIPPVTTNDVNCPVAIYPAGCVIAPIAITVSGQHTFSVSAVNAWGTSAPASLTVNINGPGQIVWVKVAK